MGEIELALEIGTDHVLHQIPSAADSLSLQLLVGPPLYPFHGRHLIQSSPENKIG